MAVKLVGDEELERMSVVANCNMNRERRLRGGNGYDVELGMDPGLYLTEVARRQGQARWLDLCCGSGMALVVASAEFTESATPVSIVGVDLVDGFAAGSTNNLEFIAASLGSWHPDTTFDLITCVHGLHYIGDKLGLIQSALGWLSPTGLFVANVDSSTIIVEDASSRAVTTSWRNAGLIYDSRKKLLSREGSGAVSFPFRYLGADPEAGPNYTGQPAVDSHYGIA